MNNKNIFTQNSAKFSLMNATQEFSLIRLRMTIGGLHFSYIYSSRNITPTTTLKNELINALEDVSLFE